MFDEHHSSLLQQGYLQYITNSSNEKVFAVLSSNKFICYPEDPLKSPAARLAPIVSFDMNYSKIVDGGPNVKRPKSFAISSGNDGRVTGEFVCPTNSIKCQWIKSILDSSKSPLILAPKVFVSAESRQSNNYGATNSPIVLSPQQPKMQLISLNRSTTPSRPLNNNEEYSAHPINNYRSSSSNQFNHQSQGYHNDNINSPSTSFANPQSQPSQSSLLLSSQRGGLTSDGQLKITRRAIGPSLVTGSGQNGQSNVSKPKPLPGWVPNTYGNNKIKSRKVSPQRASASETDNKRPVRGSSRQDSRGDQRPSKDPHSNYFHYHEDDAHNQQQQYSLQQPHSQQQYDQQPLSSSSHRGSAGSGSHSGSTGNRIDNLTVSELREALLAIPPHLRSSLVQGSDRSPEQQGGDHEERYSGGGQRGRGKYETERSAHNNTGRSKSAGPSLRDSQRHEESRHRDSGRESDRRSDHRRSDTYRSGNDRERSQSARPNYRNQQRSASQSSSRSASPPQRRPSRENGNKNVDRQYDHDSGRRRDHRDQSGDDYSSASEQDGLQEEQRDLHRDQQRHRSKSSPQSRPHQQHRAGAAPIVIDVHYRHSEDEEVNSGSSEENFRAREEGRHLDGSEDESQDSYGESPTAIDKQRAASHLRKGRDDRRDQQDYQQSRVRGHHNRSASPSERERNRDRDSRSTSRQRDSRTIHAPKPVTSRSQSAIPTRSAAMAPKSESRSPSALARSGHRRLEGDLQDERMGSSVDRKSALEWSRKLAHDKKIHADFPSSPLLHSQHSGANVNSKPQLQTSAAATPSTPLKYKYKSFSDSLERGEPPRRETVSLHSTERVGSIGHSLARSQQPQKQAPATQNAPPQHQSNGSERKAAVPKVTFPSKTQSKGGGFLDFLGSRKGAVMSAEKQTVVQPAVSAPAVNENLDPAVRANLDMLARYRAKQQQGGNIPPPVAVMNRNKLASRDSAPPAPQRSTQQHSSHQHPGYPSFSRPPPQQKGPSRDSAVVAQIHSQFDDLSSIEQEPFSPVQPASNMRRSSSQEFDHPAPSSNGPFSSEITDMAEWRRLNDWLLRNELDEYSELMRAHGITKLSILELLSAEDMRNIGIAEDDIDVAVRKVSEFTRRTRTFSEQVFYSDAEGAGAVPMPKVKPMPAKPLPTSEGGKQAAGGAGKMPYLGAAAKLSALSIPAAKSMVASSKTQVVSTTSPVAVYETKSQLRHELIVHFDCGNNELFFRAWKVATVVHFPTDYIQLNPLRPSLFNTKQIMEFHLYLYFSVHPIMTNSSKEAVRRGKDALKAYLESMVASSEHSSLLNGEAPQTTAFTPRDNGNKDGNNEAADGQQIMSPADTAMSMFSTPSLRSVTASSFMRSREFAIYAGMVMVPEPQSNEAFIQLFKHDWMAAMRVRFVQFLDIVGLTSSDDPPLVGKESDENVNVHPEENLDAPMATPKPFRPVSTALFVPSQTTPRSQHSGLETPQVYSRVGRASAAQQETDKEEEEHDDKEERSARLQRQSQQVTDNTDNLDTSDTYPSRNDVQVAAAVSSHVSHVVPPPPLDTLLSPISPEEHAKKRHGVISSVENLTSPMSTTSTISQLTDDDNNYVSHHHAVSGYKGAPATNKHISPVHTQQHPRKSLLGATSSPLIGNSSSSAANGSRGKPFTPMSRSAMQSQVNEYNKLLKQGGMKPAPVAVVGSAAAAIVSDEIAVTEQQHLLSPVVMSEGTTEETVPKKLAHAFEPTVVASESEDISKVGNSNSTPLRTSLVLGSGLKPRPIMNASSMNKILLPRDASMQNQVDEYNKLLKNKPVVLPVETVATSESFAVADSKEVALAAEVKAVEAGDQVILTVEEKVESEVKEVAAEAVEEVQPVESGEVSEQVGAETTTVELQTEPVLESVAAQSELVASVEISDELTAEEHLNSTRNEKNTVDGDGGSVVAAPEQPTVSELSEVEEDSSRQQGPAVESSVSSVPHPAVSEMAKHLASVDTLDTAAIASAAGSLYGTVPVTVDAEALQPISLAAEEPSEEPAEEPRIEESKAAPAEMVKNDALLADEEETTAAADLTPVKQTSKKNKKHNKSKKQ